MHSGASSRTADLCYQSPYPERPDHTPGRFDVVCAKIWNKIVPGIERSPPRRMLDSTRLVEAQGEACAGLSDAALRMSLADLRPRLVRHGLRPELVIAALAPLREAAHRSLGLRPHSVQLIGAFALLEGRLAEMETGEGKTLVAALAASIAALAGVPTHVVTVNDYLAGRDADLVRPLLDFAGLTVGSIRHEDDADARREEYRNDVTYVSNKEVAFDYLRDRVASEQLGRLSLGQLVFRPLRPATDAPVLRGLHFAIVDEADSILIDEARTPLILAERDSTRGTDEHHHAALAIAEQMRDGIDFTLQPGNKAVRLTASGEARVAVTDDEAGGFWRARRARDALVSQAIAARHLYRRDRDYVVADDMVRIVDEHTGRVADGRSWQHGLHQMIEILEGVTPSTQHSTRSSITYHSFFRRYIRLAGMSGTLADVSRDLALLYRLQTVRIPPYRPVCRDDRGTSMFPSASSKQAHIVRTTRDIAASGRPVLIGTRSVLSSEQLSACLRAAGLVHTVLNARHHASEAAIIAEAGQAGCITIATSMAGRGTDIRLDDRARRSGGLHVIVFEPQDSNRNDRQLIGRGGRQGDPGSYEICMSLEDELFRKHMPTFVSLLNRLRPLSVSALPHLAIPLRAWAQAAAGRRHGWSRQQVLLLQQRLQKELSFTRLL